jgi:hypothetical protein
MKAILVLLLTLVAFPSLSQAQQCGGEESPASLGIILKKAKIAHDAREAGADLQSFTACREPGYSCRSSLDCCGSSFCREGVCSDSGNSCRGPGAACRSSIDCCGSSFCRDGYCGDNGNSCRQEGAKCRSSIDCCGSNFCRDGFCG